MDVLRDLDDELDEADARLMAHAAFGLLNSTPHSVEAVGDETGRLALACQFFAR